MHFRSRFLRIFLAMFVLLFAGPQARSDQISLAFDADASEASLSITYPATSSQSIPGVYVHRVAAWKGTAHENLLLLPVPAVVEIDGVTFPVLDPVDENGAPVIENGKPLLGIISLVAATMALDAKDRGQPSPTMHAGLVSQILAKLVDVAKAGFGRYGSLKRADAEASPALIYDVATRIAAELSR